jgi:glycopeptide antibiotics resistance protein
MNSFLKKIIVVMPVAILTWLFFHARYDQLYHQVSSKRFLFFILTIGLLFFFILLDAGLRRQNGFVQLWVQSSFYVYVFAVLTLTGYFILFKEISTHDWWQRMMMRIDKKDHVNVHLFQTLKIYKLTSKQVWGNLAMLLPLAIYLKLLFTRKSGFLVIVFICLLVSVTIELLQLATSYRSADVDDVFLNTLGACFGYMLYKLSVYFIGKPLLQQPGVLVP